MNIPNLMPFQMEPLNGDIFAQHEFMFLMKKWGLKKAIETGTCLGSTTMFLANMYELVGTIEINSKYLDIAKEIFEEKNVKNIGTLLGDSGKGLSFVIENLNCDNDTFFFLDGHWGNHCPLIQELRQIADAGLKPVIAIHDWKVPNEPKLGFDTWNGQEFTFDWIKPSIDAIYGENNYDYYYNSAEKAGGAMRGIIYITPKQRVRLLNEYYLSDSDERNAELEVCYQANQNNLEIDSVDMDTNRKTFNEFFAKTQDAMPTEISIIANADIYFDEESIRLIKRYIRPNVCFAISRWDVSKDGQVRLFNRPDSQDVWVFQGNVPQMEGADFTLGNWGVDNRMAHIIQANGYELINPAHTIKAYHVHHSGVRTASIETKVPPPYKLVKLIKL